MVKITIEVGEWTVEISNENGPTEATDQEVRDAIDQPSGNTKVYEN